MVCQTLIVCHGARHRPRYKNAETMDVDKSVRPTYLKDLTLPSFRHHRTYKRIVIHNCPHHLLLPDLLSRTHAIFRRPRDRFDRGLVDQLEQVVDEVQDVHVFTVTPASDGMLVAHDDILNNHIGGERVPLRESFFRYEDKFYGNYTILPSRQLRFNVHTWLNLYGMLDDEAGVLVIRAPNPRTLAVHYGARGGWSATLRSLTQYISQSTGTAFVHGGTRRNPAYDNFVVGDEAPFFFYEDHDWTLKRVSVVDRFTTLDETS